MPDDAEPEPADVLQATLDLLRDLEVYRAEHGPFLRELRCPWGVRVYLQAVLPKAEPSPFAVPSLPLPLPGVPLVEDADVPAGMLRQVFDDGHHEDLRVLALPEVYRPPFEFEPYRPEFRCPSCTTSVPVPGLCVYCRRPVSSLFGSPKTTGLGGLADV